MKYLALAALFSLSAFSAIDQVSQGQNISANKINEVITGVNSLANLPTGSTISFAGASCPTGYLAMDGSAISRAANPELFSALGVKFGAGDGSTTFNLPQRTYNSGVIGESVFKGVTLNRPASGVLGPLTANSALLPPALSGVATLGSWQLIDLNVPRQVIHNLPPGLYRATFTFKGWVVANTNAYSTIFDGAAACDSNSGSDLGGLSMGQSVSCVFKYTNSGNRSFELYVSGASSPYHVESPIRFQLEYAPLQSDVSGNCIKN